MSYTSSSGYKLVCYYTNWSQYRPNAGKFLPKHIPAHLCTHLIFAFAGIENGKLCTLDSTDEDLYKRIISLKRDNPMLKVLLGIGGVLFGTEKFKDLSSSRNSRKIFIRSAIPFLRERDFDGLDIDWEYPNGTEDKTNFVLLLKELREAFEAEGQARRRLLLTAAVAVGPDKVASGYDVPAVSRYLDFINLMAYDFHGAWADHTGHNAPLYASSSASGWGRQMCVDHAASMWVRLGAPKDKLVIGMPTYGRSFSLSNPGRNGVNSAARGPGKQGDYTKEEGILAYYEICKMLDNGASYIWDDEAKVPYCVLGDQWVSFDDKKSISMKMKWIKHRDYAGAMVWTLDMDDFTGTRGFRYPLIGAMREELLG